VGQMREGAEIGAPFAAAVAPRRQLMACREREICHDHALGLHCSETAVGPTASADRRQRLDAVNFSLGRFAIYAAKLKGVAAEVVDGRVGSEAGNTGPNFAAAYSTRPDRHFTLRSLNSSRMTTGDTRSCTSGTCRIRPQTKGRSALARPSDRL
jgi:hypothetical protein